MSTRVHLFGSVGKGGMNMPPDVVAVQTLLNQHIASLSTKQLLATNGTADNATIEAIVAFQREVVHQQNRTDASIRTGRRFAS